VSVVSTTRDKLERWGWRRFLLGAIYNRLRRLVGLRVFVINARPLDPSKQLPKLPVGHQVRRVENQDYQKASESDELGISASFLQAAHQRGDICIGYFVENELVSYFWCGFSEVPSEPGLDIVVPQHYSYAYKAMTLADFRGMRLQEILTHANDKLLVAEGFTHNIEYIDVSNFAQKQASARYGNSTVGRVWLLRHRQKVLMWQSRALRQLGFAFRKS